MDHYPLMLQEYTQQECSDFSYTAINMIVAHTLWTKIHTPGGEYFNLQRLNFQSGANWGLWIQF